MPTRFELTLVQGGNALSGNVLDDGYLGEAQVSGEITGNMAHPSVRRALAGDSAFAGM